VKKGFRSSKEQKNKKPRFDKENIEKKRIEAFLNNN
jgi:hypothetical protein